MEHGQDKLTGAIKREMWASGEMGGFECYIMADEEAAEVVFVCVCVCVCVVCVCVVHVQWRSGALYRAFRTRKPFRWCIGFLLKGLAHFMA